MTTSLLYSVEREYSVSIDRLWRAWTDAAELEKWYHPVDLSSTEGATVSELKLGGLWSCGVEVAALGYTAYFFGQYTKIVEYELMEHTLHYTESPDEFAQLDFSSDSHLIRVEFQVRGDISWCKFSQFGELPEGQAEMAQAGMNSYLDSLGLHLGT